MSLKIGRNEPCPCGSGKKYKKCCLQATASVVSNDMVWQRVNKAHNGLIKKVLKFITETYGPTAVHEAWDEFCLYEDVDGFDPESSLMPFFMPWFFYTWTPDPDETDITSNISFDMSPGEALIHSKQGQNLSDIEVEYIQSCCETPFSFYQIVDSTPGVNVSVKDLLTEKEFLVIEKTGSKAAVKGNIFFTRVVHVQGMHLFDGLAPIQIPSQFGIEIIDLREFFQNETGLAIDSEMLFEIEEHLFSIFWSIWEELHNPKTPTLQNTDGHLMIPHKLIYEIDSIDQMFEILHPLCFQSSRAELLEGSKMTKEGELISIEFPWLAKGNKQNKGWSNTVFGHISLEQRKMTVEVNSKERATRFKALLTKKTKTGWTLKSTLIEPVESQLENLNTHPRAAEKAPSSEELMAIPEVKEKIESMIKSHWDDWVNVPLPALNGETPMAASKTKAGKDKLELLLADFENKMDTRPVPGLKPETFKEIRKKLGLSF